MDILRIGIISLLTNISLGYIIFKLPFKMDKMDKNIFFRYSQGGHGPKRNVHFVHLGGVRKKS
jgi:hypothetical protein